MPESAPGRCGAVREVNGHRRTGVRGQGAGVYFMRVLCRDRRRAQTFALSLNDDLGDATEAWRACPPTSGKPEGSQAFPLEPRVQGRFARIDMAEDVSLRFPVPGAVRAPGWQ